MLRRAHATIDLELGAEPACVESLPSVGVTLPHPETREADRGQDDRAEMSPRETESPRRGLIRLRRYQRSPRAICQRASWVDS